MAERFFVLTDLTDTNQTLQSLQDKGYDVLHCELEEPFEGFGLIVKEKDFEDVRKICCLSPSPYTLLETDKDDLFVVSWNIRLDPRDPTFDLQQRYAHLVIGRLGSDIAAIEKTIREHEQKIEQLTLEIYTLSANLHEEQAKLSHLEHYVVDLANQLLADFDQLSARPDVAVIEVNKGVLTVTTTPLTITLGDTLVNIGAYRIDISPKASFPLFYPTSERQIRRIKNRDYIHPLIPMDNSFTKSQVQRMLPTFAQLMGEWNFGQVIILSLNLLQNLDFESQLLLRRWQE